ncbi:DUF123 domain-containing protein [Halobacteriales archaeon QH_10_67_13]|nr:MAG: DUF123 domain-containing protein [Halobacteriales archaeon QH_10_67_13]
MTASGGTYTLLVAMPSADTLTVGALGEITFDAGWYAYTGSALGSGGFARVRRHRELARGERDTRHWHIDYLLGHPETRIAAVVRTGAGIDRECAVGRALAAEFAPVPAFGASDCNCDSHLVYADDGEALAAAIARAHER